MLIHYFIPVYHITRETIPDVAERRVLDFGCNYGIFLETSEGSFPVENYTGVDICEDAIDMGRKMFPDAKFIHYDGFNPEYNPGGKDFLPDLDGEYDLILVNSVFTHTSKEEMLSIVDTLYPYLAKGGKMMISWTGYDPDFNRFPYGPVRDQILRFFPEHKEMEYCYVYQYNENGKNKTKITQEFPTDLVLGLWTFYRVDYFQTLFPQYKKEHIMSKDWKQDLVIITRD